MYQEGITIITIEVIVTLVTMEVEVVVRDFLPVREKREETATDIILPLGQTKLFVGDVNNRDIIALSAQLNWTSIVI